jgi:hypothetical protein
MSGLNRIGRFQVIGAAYAANCLITILLALSYFEGLQAEGVMDIGYRGIALISNFGLIYLLLFALFGVPLSWVDARAWSQILNGVVLFLALRRLLAAVRAPRHHLARRPVRTPQLHPGRLVQATRLPDADPVEHLPQLTRIS